VKEVAMKVFLSYAHQDEQLVDSLRQDLADIGQTVWLDESLNGGQIWWDEILHQVRECHVFVLAISTHSLASEACLAEWAYAVDLARPFLPVRIDDSDWTAAPTGMKQTQHVEFHVGSADSVKSLAKALNSVPQSVPLPSVLPAPPPTPLSYRERYAKLFGSEPLTVDDQISYFIRLSLDVDSANAGEAIELIRALHEREDLSWKVRQRIDEFLRNLPGGTPSQTTSSVGPVDIAPPTDTGTGDTDGEPSADVAKKATDTAREASPPPRRTKRLYWALGAAVLVLAIVGALILFWPDSDGGAPHLTENTSCVADGCYSPPIRFVDLDGVPDEIEVTLTDPHGHQVRTVDSAFTAEDSTTVWEWAAQYEDPIGEYTVQFVNAGGEPVVHTFAISPTDGPFGVVQHLSEAIGNRDWQAAAAIDDRIADELDQYGTEYLEAEYPVSGETHLVRSTYLDQTNANGTTIIGASVVYTESDNTTAAYCELWSVNTDGATMRSDPLPRDGDQEKSTLTGYEPPNVFRDWVDQYCVDAANPS
jgi:hypothetical protein